MVTENYLGSVMLNQKIKFVAINKRYSKIQPAPKPAYMYKPTWYSMSPVYMSNGTPDKKLTMTDEGKNMTFKKCLPFIDTMKAGYIVELRKDMIVQHNKDNVFDLQWNSDELLFTIHNTSTNIIEPPTGYNSQVVNYIWNTIIKTPKGYSCLITQPFGWHDTPLRMIPAIVDTDKEVLNFHFPMWLKEDFTGIITKGTPLAQIIPFQRESWSMETEYLPDGELDVLAENGFNATMQNHYRDTSWSKKRFK